MGANKGGSAGTDVTTGVTQFGKDQGLAGQLARLEASRKAKDDAAADDARRGARQDGRRIDLFEAELGEDGAEGGQLFREERSQRLYGDILGGDARAAGDDDGLGLRVGQQVQYVFADGVAVIVHDPVVHYLVPFAAGPLGDPLTGGVCCEGSRR